MHILISLGLGLGLVLQGVLYQGSRGLIEGGHSIIDNQNHGRHCSCGQIGCVEAYSSGKSTSIRMYEADIAEENERLKSKNCLKIVIDSNIDDSIFLFCSILFYCILLYFVLFYPIQF